MKINNPPGLYFYFLFIIPYLIWFLFCLIYIFNSDLIKAGELSGFIKLGNDSSRYLYEAEKLVNFNFSNLYLTKLSYIFLIALVKFLNIDLTSIIIFQFASTIIASYCLYSMGEKISSKWVGLICLSLFLTYIPIQLRNFYLLTEILFINFSIILTYLFFFKKEKKILIFLIGLFVLFLRPQSLLIILSIIFSVFLFFKFYKKYNFVIKFFLISLSLIFIFFFSKLGIHEYNLINALSKGVIWGYSFETNSICNENCIPGLTNPDNYNKDIFGLLLYVKNNFFILTKISVHKIILFFTGWRPYYSNIQNLYLIIIHIPTYGFFCYYFLKLKRFNAFETFTLCYVILSVIFVLFTFVDWSGRFIMYILPFIMLYASKGFLNLFLNIKKQYTLNK